MMIAITMLALSAEASAQATDAASCSTTKKGLKRCRQETLGGALTIDTDPAGNTVVARYLTFGTEWPPTEAQKTLLGIALARFGDGNNTTKMLTAWKACMNAEGRLITIKLGNTNWTFSNPTDDVCGIDITNAAPREKSY
ncbi:hypothetical protein [Methylobacterium ajmalii]|uniref:hypothetical protein n=1 Tax=Methylobacterium ajmalii TaxID=2738439 RepID=UPI002F2DCDE7